MAARPPLSERWFLLFKDDAVAQNGCLLAYWAITQEILQSIPAPQCWTYVAAVLSLQLGLFAFLDYRDWVRQRVQAEASNVDPSLSVSSALLLSSPELQDLYHRWMDNLTPAVMCSRYLFPLVTLCVTLKAMSKNVDGCNGFALVASLPASVLALVRMAMDFSGAPKQSQSIASLVAMAYLVASVTGMAALNNRCVLGVGPDWMSPPGIAAFITLETAAVFAVIPCTMQHLPALCVIAGPCHLVTCYIRSQRRHGGLGLVSYPTHNVELAIIIAAAKTAALLVGAAVRYRLAHENMTAFLRTVRLRRH